MEVYRPAMSPSCRIIDIVTPALMARRELMKACRSEMKTICQAMKASGQEMMIFF
jgi:hypothetical protein